MREDKDGRDSEKEGKQRRAIKEKGGSREEGEIKEG